MPLIQKQKREVKRPVTIKLERVWPIGSVPMHGFWTAAGIMSSRASCNT